MSETEAVVEKYDIRENKHDRFRRIAQPRVNNAVLAIERVGRCSRKESYEYTAEEVDAMFNALQSALDNARSNFAPKATRQIFAFDEA